MPFSKAARVVYYLVDALERLEDLELRGQEAHLIESALVSVNECTACLGRGSQIEASRTVNCRTCDGAGMLLDERVEDSESAETP